MTHGYQTSDARKRAEAAVRLDRYVHETDGTLLLGTLCVCGARSGLLTGGGWLRCADCCRVIRGPAAQ